MYTNIVCLKNNNMSTVWLCEDTIGKKTVRKHLYQFADPNIYSMLQRERPPYVPEIYEINELHNGGKPVLEIIEEYIDGITIDKVQLSFDEKLALSAMMCCAIARFHKLQIINRDIKPSNIIIDHANNIKFIDFSIARFYDENKDNDTVPLGTVGYFAPEQCGYAQSDRRTDIFALGQTMKSIFGENPEDNAVSRIINKCTMTDPQNRYQSCDELFRAVDRLYKRRNSEHKSAPLINTAMGLCLLPLFPGLIVAIGSNLYNLKTYSELSRKLHNYK